MALCALLAAGTAAAWQVKPPAPATPPPAKPVVRAKAAPAVPDAQIEAAIRGKFAKSKISADHFTVRVQGGVATIEGKTETIQHKGTATRLAKTGGATAVNNHIQISEAARADARKNLEEGRRRVQVKRSEARSDPAPARPQR
jgi:hypothetical protein